jgi:hypothetical protein
MHQREGSWGNQEYLILFEADPRSTDRFHVMIHRMDPDMRVIDGCAVMVSSNGNQIAGEVIRYAVEKGILVLETELGVQVLSDEDFDGVQYLHGPLDSEWHGVAPFVLTNLLHIFNVKATTS